MHSRRDIFLLAAVALGPVACSSSSDGSPLADGGGHPMDGGGHVGEGGTGTDGGEGDAALGAAADMAFWNAFWAGDMNAGIEDIPALQGAIKATPKDWYDNLLVGMDALWQLAELGRDPQNATKVSETYGIMAAESLGIAHSLNGGDAFTTALDGFVVWNEGVNTNSSTLEQQGEGLVKQAYEQSPPIGWFIQTIMAGSAPVGSSLMTTALANGWTYYASCSGAKLSESSPDYTAFFSAFVTKANGGDGTLCSTQFLAPYWLEGNLLYFGDLLVKAGNVPAALAAYTAATMLTNYSSWPHKDVLEARRAGGSDAGADGGMTLEQRAMAYAGPESQWPPFAAAPFVCGTCHNKTTL
jgi:hypothetical protein